MSAASWKSGVLAVALGAAGCSDATLSELRPGLEGNGFQCWLTVNLKKLPRGDPQDLRVILSSVVLYQEMSYDWDYLTANDYMLVDQQDSLGNAIQKYVPDDSTTVNDPPHPMKMRVKFVPPSKPTVKLGSGDDLTVTATLYWGGKKQDSISRGLMMAYQRK